jgi:hypothetical protein
MSLENKLNSLKQIRDLNNVCTVGGIINELPEVEKKALVSALSSKASTRGIYDALKSEGFKIDRQTITLHRKGYCRCKEQE